MFHENLKALRKDRGLSQEELAVRLNVVRQTISKWEKGLSVPDAAMLIRLAEVLDTTVSRLLGADVPEDEADRDRLAEQLARINEQLAVRNRRGRFILRLVLGILAAFVVVNLLLILFSYGAFRAFQEPVQTITALRSCCCRTAHRNKPGWGPPNGRSPAVLQPLLDSLAQGLS